MGGVDRGNRNDNHNTDSVCLTTTEKKGKGSRGGMPDLVNDTHCESETDDDDLIFGGEGREDLDFDANTTSDDNYDEMLWNESADGSLALIENHSNDDVHDHDDVHVHDEGSSSCSMMRKSKNDGAANTSKELSRKSSQVTKETEAMTEETTEGDAAASNEESFTFEIALPPPSDVSPLGGNESVIAAMMSRSIDRALEMSPAPPFSGDSNYRSSTKEGQYPKNDSSSNSSNNHNVGGRRNSSRRSEQNLVSSTSNHSSDSSDRHHRTHQHTHTSRSSRHIHGKGHRDEQPPRASTRRLRSTSEQPTSRQRSRSRSSRDILSSSNDNHDKDKYRRSKSKSRESSRSSSSKSGQHRSRSSSRTKPSSSTTRHQHRSDHRHQAKSSRHITAIPEVENEGEDSNDDDDERKYRHKSSRNAMSQRSRSMSRPRPSRNNSSGGRERSKSRPRGHDNDKGEKEIRKSRRRSPSTSRKRSPSRSRQENRATSRSVSVPPKSSSSGTAGLFVQSVMKPVKLRSSGPSFLSRLEESKEASSSTPAEAAHGNSLGDDQNQSPSVRWNFSTTTPSTQSSRRGGQLLSAVSEEELPENKRSLEKPIDPPATSRSTRDDRREERRRMRSKSRNRQRHRDPDNHDQDQRRKTPKWSDLNNSISNLNASRGTFDFDASLSGDIMGGDNKQTKIPNTNQCKSVQPKITPVAIKNGGKLDADVIASVLAGTGAVVSSTQDKRMRRSDNRDVGDIINETKQRTREIRRRRAKPEKSSSLRESAHSTPEYPSHMDAMERLRRANALILEKKKRREDSKVRQKQLENKNDGPSDDLMAMVSFHESKDDMEPYFAPVAQFEPAISNNPEDNVADDKSTEHRSGRSNIKGLKSLKKGMKYIGKSGRNLMALVSSEDGDDDEEDENGKDEPATGEAHSASNTEKRRSRRVDRDKHSSSQKSSKWKELKYGLDSLKKANRPVDTKTGAGQSFDEPEPRLEAPKSIRWGSQRKVRSIDDELDFPDDSVQAPKKPGSSRWGSVKNSISFINKMKHAAESKS